MKLKKYIGFVQNGVSYGMLRLGETQFLFLDTGQEEAQRQLEIDHEQFDDGWKFIYNGEYFRNYRARQRTYISDTLLVSDDIKSRNTILIHHIPFFGNHTNNDLKDIYQEIGGDLINDLNVKLAINGHIHYFRTVNKERWNGYYNGIVYKNNYPYITAGGPDSPWIPGYIENPLGEIYSMLVLKKKGNQYLIDYYSMSNNLQIQKKYYEINNKGQIVSI